MESKKASTLSTMSHSNTNKKINEEQEAPQVVCLVSFSAWSVHWQASLYLS
jgi:hypothetical protein